MLTVSNEHFYAEMHRIHSAFGLYYIWVFMCKIITWNV